MPALVEQIEQAIIRLTQRRIWDLKIEYESERIVLHGEADSFYSKSLAQQGVREVLPQIRLHNAIRVA